MARTQVAKIGRWVQCNRCALVVGPLGPLTASALKSKHGGTERGACGGTLAVTDGDGLIHRVLSGEKLAPAARKLLRGMLAYLARAVSYVGAEHLGFLLKHARMEQGLSQAQVAERLRTAGGKGTQTTVGDSEREGPQVLAVAQKHAAALGLRILFAVEPFAVTPPAGDTERP